MSGDNGGGYGKPPKSGQFKKGQSGNPRGRKPNPKYANPVDRLFAQKIPMMINGRRKLVGPVEAVTTQIISGAMKGDPKATTQFYRLADKSPVFKALLDQHQNVRPIIKFPYVQFRTHASEMFEDLGITYENEHRVMCIKTWALDAALQRMKRKSMSDDEFRGIKYNCEDPEGLPALLDKYGIEVEPLQPPEM